MTNPDPHAPPPEAGFHGHDAPDRLETEEHRRDAVDGDHGADGDGDEPTTGLRSRPADGPRGAGVKDPKEAGR